MCDELVHPTHDDVHKIDGDNGADLPRWEIVVTIAQVEDNSSDNQLSDGEHEVMHEIGVQLFVVVIEKRPETMQHKIKDTNLSHYYNYNNNTEVLTKRKHLVLPQLGTLYKKKKKKKKG